MAKRSPSEPQPASPKTEGATDQHHIDPDKMLKDLDVRTNHREERDSALTDVLSPGGTREDDDRDRTGFVKPHRFQHT